MSTGTTAAEKKPPGTETRTLTTRTRTAQQPLSVAPGHRLRLWAGGDGAARLPGCDVTVVAGALDKDAADCALAAALLLPWEQHHVVVYGRKVPERRETLYCATDPELTYAYSGRTCAPVPLPDALLGLKALAERVATEATGAAEPVEFNACLLNLYRDGSRTIGMHSDDESDLARGSPIVSVSLGASRFFDLRGRDATAEGAGADGPRARLVLDHGTVVVMAGATQRNYKHGVPSQARVREPRVSLTFRCVTRTKHPTKHRREEAVRSEAVCAEGAVRGGE